MEKGITRIERAENLIRLAHKLKLELTGVSLDWITDRFDCDEATAKDYLYALESLGFAYEIIRAQGGTRYKLIHEPDKFPDQLKISTDSIIPFYYLLNIAPEIEGTFLESLTEKAFMFFEPFVESSNSVIASKTYKEISSVEEYFKRAKRLFLNHKGLGRVILSAADQPFQCLVHAAMKQKECSITYSSISEKRTLNLIIQPLHFIRYRDSLSLLAMVVSKGKRPFFRNLVLKRIISAKEMNNSFDYPEIDLNNLLKEIPRSDLRYEISGTDMVTVVLWIDPEIARFVRDYRWGNFQRVKDMKKRESSLSLMHLIIMN